MGIEMNEIDLKRMKRVELLEMLYEQQKRIEELEEENKKLNEYLQKKTIILKESGSIATASLALTNVFEEAQKAADIYLQSITEIYKNADTYLQKISAIYDDAKNGKIDENLDLPLETRLSRRGRHSK